MTPKWFLTLSLWINAITPIHFMVAATAYAGFLNLIGNMHAALVFFFTMVMVLGLVGVIKIVTRVERRPDCLVTFGHSNRAFPSGHVASAAFITTMVPYTLPYSDLTYLTLACLVALTIMVALSRLALRAHTLTQVVVGFVLGLGIPLVAIAVINPPLIEALLLSLPWG